jgi:hypothetical protein
MKADRSQPQRPTLRLRKATWRVPRESAPEPIDYGPHLLEDIARGIGIRAESVFRGSAQIAYAPPIRGDHLGMPSDRVWHSESAGRSFWCALSADGQRGLLEFVLAGPGAAIPTAMERTIVAECIDRLLSSSPTHHWLDTSLEAPPAGTWRCSIDLTAGGRAVALLQLFTRAAAVIPKAASIQPSLDDVTLPLRARLASVRSTLTALSAWKVGTVLALPGRELAAELVMDRGPVVHGVVGGADGLRAVRLTGSAMLHSR